MVVLRGSTVVDSEGVVEGDVAIEDGKIAGVGDVSADDKEVDVGGMFVAPGLVDAHVHLPFDGRPDVESAVRQSESIMAYHVAANLEKTLHAGVTTVRDLGSPGSLGTDAKKAVNEGVLEGPNVVPCGQNIVMTGGHGHWFGREADGPSEVRKAVREQLKKGADVIKCMATGGVLTEGALTGAPELDEEELDVLVRAADAKNVPTAAHAHGTSGIKNAVRAGITSIEHGTFMDREAAEMMAKRGTYWVPTAKALHGIIEHGTEAGIPEYAVAKTEDAVDSHANAFDLALDADVPIAMGTDAGTPFNYHEDIPEELELMVERGMTAEHALEAATVNSADLLGLDDVGLVKEGYRADLVVLEENPLEDVTAWQDPVHVIKDGELV